MEVLAESHSELRAKERYRIQDERFWTLKIEGRSYPLDWLHDFSLTGMQIRQGVYQGFAEGQKVHIDLQFMGHTLVAVPAEVRWLKKDESRLNMKVLGLEFEDPKRRVSKQWKRLKFKFAVERVEDYRAQVEETKSNRLSLSRIKISSVHVTSSLVVAFLAGFSFSFFG